MRKAKKIGNPKAEIRWEPTEFRCLHSLLLLSCKSKPSAGFANIINAHEVISVNRIPTEVIIYCRLLTPSIIFKLAFFLDRILLIPVTPRNTLFIVIFQMRKCHNTSTMKQPQRAISANEMASCSGYARCNDATSTNDAPINSWTIVTRTRDFGFCSKA